MQRTTRQNRALHLFFKQLADELNDKGLDIRTTLKYDFDIPWNEARVKELLFRPLMEAMLKRGSTTELETQEIDEVFEVLMKTLGEKHGIELDFPSIETIIKEDK